MCKYSDRRAVMPKCAAAAAAAAFISHYSSADERTS